MIIEIMQIIAIIGLVGGFSLIAYKFFSTHDFYGDDNTSNTQNVHRKSM